MNVSRRPRAAQGFTLIELLVVIAIIAILAAILFPVFAQARAKARQADCESNLKQLSLAIIQYTQDNDELMPFGEVNIGGAAWTLSRYALPSPAGSQVSGLMWGNSIQSYLKNYNVFQCKSTALSLGSGPYPYATYTYNGVLQSYPQSGILAPASVTLLWSGELDNSMYHYVAASPVLDCPDPKAPCVYVPTNADGSCASGNGATDEPYVVGGSPSSTLSNYSKYVHGMGDNFAYVDGHIKWVSYGGDPNAGDPWGPTDSSGNVLQGGGFNWYNDSMGQCHSYHFEPDFTP